MKERCVEPSIVNALCQPDMARLGVIMVAAALATRPMAPSSAQTTITLSPRDSTDWKIWKTEGPVTCSVRVSRDPEHDGSPLWVFKADAVEGRTAQAVWLRLPLEKFGIPFLDPKDAGLWTWSWWVRNQRTADYVAIGPFMEAGFRSIAASHNLYDNATPVVPRPPTEFQMERARLREAVAEMNLRSQGGRVEQWDRITGIGLCLMIPHEQEVWLGPIHLGPDPDTSAVPDLKKEVRHGPPGLFHVADLYGDGTVEVITPWSANDKVWSYDRRAGRYVPDSRRDDLSRHDPFLRVCSGDVDGDGDVDLVAADPDMETIETLLQSADGFRGRPIHLDLPIETAGLTTMALADDDRDGDEDLFIGYVNLGQQTGISCITRLSGDGRGGFSPAQGVPATGRGGPVFQTYHVTHADLNGDGHLDLLTADGLALHVLPGVGDGSYREPVLVTSFQPDLKPNGFFRDLVIGDMNGDCRDDIYVSILTGSPETERGRNFLALNRGDLVFEEIAAIYGLEGSRQTCDACLADVDGREGPELVLLESGQIIAYDLGAFREMLRAGTSGPVPARILARRAIDFLGAQMFSCQDIDGDGAVDLVLSMETGPKVHRLAESGPVRRIDAGGLGPLARRAGVRIGSPSGAWRTSLQTNHRTGVEPQLIAAGEPVRIWNARGDSSHVLTGRSGDYQRVDPAGFDDAGFFSRVSRWFLYRRHTAGEHLELVWNSPWGKGVTAVMGALVAAALIWLNRRERWRKLSESYWLQVLQQVGISTHADWVQHFPNAAHRLNRAAVVSRQNPPDRKAVQEHIEGARILIPPELLETFSETLSMASELRIEGARSALNALRTLSEIHRDGQPEFDRLLAAGKTVDNRLRIIQEVLAERFRCDAGAVFRRVHARHHCGTSFELVSSDEKLSTRFPMLGRHLYMCLDELFSNALKKRPRPSRITVTIAPAGQKSVLLEVWDNGHGIAVESGRSDRPGNRLGLSQIEGILANYRGGKVRLRDTPGGGVAVEFRLPRFDVS